VLAFIDPVRRGAAAHDVAENALLFFAIRHAMRLRSSDLMGFSPGNFSCIGGDPGATHPSP